MFKLSGAIFWRLGYRSTTSRVQRFSSPRTTVQHTCEPATARSISDSNAKVSTQEEKGLVAAAFASLNNPESDDKAPRKPSPKSSKPSRTQQLDHQILTASDVNSLLTMAESAVVSRRHALKMVSVLSEWSSSNRVKLSEFEKDPRFLKLCRILARSPTSAAVSSLTMAEDLSTVLGITGDDEAARLIMNLSLTQMIKVMKVLNQKGRRSTPLLRALSHNIVTQPEVIDLKRSADLLYCMASLNFPDPALLDRICSDIIGSLASNTDRPAVVHSIVVSLGLLKYRHVEALTTLCGWLAEHSAICRGSDIASAVVTLHTLHYMPPEPHSEQIFQIAVNLKEEELLKPGAWLDLVFSLLTLGKAQLHHLHSCMKPEFIDKLLSAGEIPIPSRRKLIAIDAYLSLTSPTSPRLPEDIAVGVPVLYTKEKALFVQSVMDTFKSLVSADSFLRRDCNSGMGFLYDAEFAVDAKCHPVPLDKAVNNKNVYRIAVLSLDYHDMTRRSVEPLGLYHLYTELLQLKGFKVLQIPYTEFNPKDKLVTRVQYIEKRLKDLVSDKAASA